MQLELICVNVVVNRGNGEETLSETFIAPSYIIKTFAEFLSNRDEEETFKVSEQNIAFQDCNVIVADSKHAVSSFECLKRHNIPLSNFALCHAIIENGKDGKWDKEDEFITFSNWCRKNCLNPETEETQEK